MYLDDSTKGYVWQNIEHNIKQVTTKITKFLGTFLLVNNHHLF